MLQLSKMLEKSDQVKRYGSKEESGGWKVVYCLKGVEESANNVFPELLAKLEKAKSSKQIDKALFDIEKELKHLVDHIADSHFFSHLVDSSDRK